MSILPEEIKTLPSLARYTVEEYINTGAIINFDNIDFEDYKNKQAGVFVTLKIEGHLRGCIGTISPTQKNIIIETVMNAISASTRDPRFRPVDKIELKDISYSVSLLMPPEVIDSKEMLDPNRYGVIVTSGHKRGLLLPRLESINTIDEQLYHAMMKAGIRQHEPISLSRFESIEFHE
ncbi:MAG: AmmeMemoRadiSam system protein A [Candidatus Sericytochromatia bacterium]